MNQKCRQQLPPGSRISPSACSALWEHFDEHCGSRSSKHSNALQLDTTLHSLAAEFQLSRSQVTRQWDRWRIARRSLREGISSGTASSTNSKAHEHTASLHAHRRRAFGVDDTLHNRLQSIAYDAHFVAEAAQRFAQWPLVANLRCGAWYAAPDVFTASVRFKSTDGHLGEWSLNSRRLNLHLVTIIAERGGALLVDATRRGRVLPDSFAKTVPIWCACINRACIAERGGEEDLSAWCTQLETPQYVDAAEKAAIEERLEKFVSVLRRCVGSHQVLGALTKPLRPLWLTAAPGGGLLTGANSDITDMVQSSKDLPFAPVICVSASEPIDRERRADYTYLQGSADDEEDWAMFSKDKRLTAALFWTHYHSIYDARADTCSELVESIVSLDAHAENSESMELAFGWITTVPHLTAAIAVGRRRAGRQPECWQQVIVYACCIHACIAGRLVPASLLYARVARSVTRAPHVVVDMHSSMPS